MYSLPAGTARVVFFFPFQIFFFQWTSESLVLLTPPLLFQSQGHNRNTYVFLSVPKEICGLWKQTVHSNYYQQFYKGRDEGQLSGEEQISQQKTDVEEGHSAQRLKKPSVETWVPTSLLGRGCVCVWFDPPVKSHHNWEIELHYPEGPAGEAEVCECSVAQSCPTLWDPVDCSPPVSSVHGILQPRTLEWVSVSYSRGSSPPRDRTSISLIHLPHWWAGSLA